MEKFSFLPEGAVITEKTIWRKYLEMTERPALLGAKLPDGLTAVRAEKPPVHFYKYLYAATGLDLDWVDRLLMPEAELLAAVHDERVHVHVFYEKGCPVGYVELDFRQPGEVELKYFGLMPHGRGRGWGRDLLRWAIERAWAPAGIRRMHFSTCELDDERALPMYLAAGFRVFLEATEVQRVLR